MRSELINTYLQSQLTNYQSNRPELLPHKPKGLGIFKESLTNNIKVDFPNATMFDAWLLNDKLTLRKILNNKKQTLVKSMKNILSSIKV